MDDERERDGPERADTQAAGNVASLLIAEVVVHDEQQRRDDIQFLTSIANVYPKALAVLSKEKALRALLERQKLAAEELQHRVRNDLYVVCGMLDTCARSAPDDMTRQGIGSISHRVMTLAQIYDSLLGAGLSDTMDFGFYLQKLCPTLAELHEEQAHKIDLICRIEPIFLPLDSVTALGKVVTELVTNSCRHAFPGQGGTITVTLARSANLGDASLTVQDNGVGFAETTAVSRRGIGIVRRLMTQIGGTLNVQSKEGTLWVLTFPVPVAATT